MTKILLSMVICVLMVSRVARSGQMCGKPKIDAIAYMAYKKMWFVTERDQFWTFKDEDLPPSEDSMRIHKDFSKADAAVFIDKQKGCGSTNDQLIIMVRLSDDPIQVIEFDTNTNEWKPPMKWTEHPILSPIPVDESKEIKAMFAIDTVVFVIQDNTYSAVDWKPICTNPTDPPKLLVQKQSLNGLSLNDPEKKSLQAITYKENFLYLIFDNNEYFKIKISSSLKSSKGIIQGTRGNKFKVSTDLFKLEKCSGGSSKTANKVPGQEKDEPNGSDKSIESLLLVLGLSLSCLLLLS